MTHDEVLLLWTVAVAFAFLASVAYLKGKEKP